MEQFVCPYCQSQIGEGDNFCLKCGQKIAGTANTENTLPSYVLNNPNSDAARTNNNLPPENGSLAHKKPDYPKANPFGRIKAILIDMVIGLFLYIPALMLLWVDGLGDVIVNSPEDALVENVSALYLQHSGAVFIGVGILILAVLWSAFYGFCKDGFGSGQSFGKKAQGLMVVTLENNKPCTMVRSILRLLVYYVPYISGILTWVELILIFTDKKGLRLGDRLAGTQVIEKINYKIN